MPRKYHYFISYSHESGFGNGETYRYKPFENIADIMELAREYEKELGYREGSVVIISYQRF